MAKTRAQLNKAVRAEALRDQLSAQGHVQHAVDIIGKVGKLKKDKSQLPVLQAKFNMHMRLVDKYLPDLKSVEQTIDVELTAHKISDKPLSASEWDEQYCMEPTAGPTESIN